MEEKDLERLRENGFDVDGALHRFLNNTKLYETCLKKFLNDKSYEEMKQGYLDGNVENTFRAAHTLKGLTSNLGMDTLYKALQPMVEELRAGNMPQDVEMQEVGELYKKTYELVETL